MAGSKLNRIRRLLATMIVLVAVVLLFFVASPVYAATNPTIIQWGNVSPATQYQVFYNVVQTGDWLILAESYIQTVDTTPSTSAFSFSFLSADGLTVYRTTPLWSYGDRPISIYISAADVTSLGLAVGGAYIIKLAGNPAFFASSVNNTIQATLSGTDYTNQALATDSLNPLKAFCVQMGQHMQTTDSVSTYLIAVGGSYYVTSVAAPLYLIGVPSLDIMCPILFQTSVEPMTVPTGTYNTNYGDNISVQNMLGTQANIGIGNLAAWFGLPDNTAAKALILLGMGGIALFIISRRVQDRSMLLIFGVIFFAFAVWIGIGSWALMIMVAIIVAALFFYYLWSRGVL